MGDVRRRRPHGAADARCFRTWIASAGRACRAQPDARGQVVASLFPKTRQESMLFMGMHGEVWLEPGVGLDEAVETPPWLAAGHSAKVVLVWARATRPCSRCPTCCSC